MQFIWSVALLCVVDFLSNVCRNNSFSKALVFDMLSLNLLLLVLVVFIASQLRSISSTYCLQSVDNSLFFFFGWFTVEALHAGKNFSSRITSAAEEEERTLDKRKICVLKGLLQIAIIYEYYFSSHEEASEFYISISGVYLYLSSYVQAKLCTDFSWGSKKHVDHIIDFWFRLSFLLSTILCIFGEQDFVFMVQVVGMRCYPRLTVISFIAAHLTCFIIVLFASYGNTTQVPSLWIGAIMVLAVLSSLTEDKRLSIQLFTLLGFGAASGTLKTSSACSVAIVVVTFYFLLLERSIWVALTSLSLFSFKYIMSYSTPLRFQTYYEHIGNSSLEICILKFICLYSGKQSVLVLIAIVLLVITAGFWKSYVKDLKLQNSAKLSIIFALAASVGFSAVGHWIPIEFILTAKGAILLWFLHGRRVRETESDAFEISEKGIILALIAYTAALQAFSDITKMQPVWHTYSNCYNSNDVAIAERDLLVDLENSHEESISEKRVVFVGDSIMRNLYYATRHNINTRYGFPIAKYHSNLSYTNDTIRTSLEFVWAPFTENLTNFFEAFEYTVPTFVLAATGSWDALHLRNTTTYIQALKKMQDPVCRLRKTGHRFYWLSLGATFDSKFITREKRQFLSSDKLAKYRTAFNLDKCFHSELDLYVMTKSRYHDCIDGLHFTPRTYIGISNVILSVIS